MWYNVSQNCFKGGPSDLGTTNFTKKSEKSSFYSQSLSTFIHKSLVVENHPTTREIRDLLRPRSTPKGKTVYFYISSSLIYILEIHRQSFEYNYMFVMLLNFSVISHLIFPQFFFFSFSFLAQSLKIT